MNTPPNSRWRRTAEPPNRSARYGNSETPFTLDLAILAAVAQLLVRRHHTLQRSSNETMNAMNTQMKATWRKMVGTALLWVAFAALISVPSSSGGARGAMVACLGFLSFASGLALFADGFKRDIVEQLRRDRSEHAA